ncbi:MAG: hypothetical protein C0481_03930 [Phenylobacterium sp.]|uniref:lasso peptide biosynthesis B2 protein n=1 Tax=Phenylobacterium sp. TaxID=1871053 RepID=UPI0025DE423A|nr:lasso peptide biosynthesis B2 protein [Phenylobacterium sp.]MBA4010993.1 hypothetical protein [Phenylobacterium sp.]
MRFTHHTYAAAPGGDLVLLNLAQGGYGCLPGCGALLTVTPGEDGVALADPELERALLEMGAIEEGPARRRPAAAASERDLSGMALPRPQLSDLAALAGALGQMNAEYRRASFGEVIASARLHGLGAGGDLARIEELALVFRRMLPWIPWQGVCLYRSWLLLAFLRRRGVSATWVFGVQTYPFEAHCWLQAGDLVLDDYVEHVRGFAPILALAP